MAREYFNAYHSYLDAIEPLNDAERGRLFTACLFYSMTGEVPELRGNERFVFAGMKSQIDRDSQQYENRCEANRKNGSLGGQSKLSDRYQSLPNATDGYQTPPKEKEKEKAKEKEKTKENIVRGKMSCYATRADFLSLPPVIRRAVGSASQLCQWAMTDLDSLSVTQSNFMRSYRAALESEQQRAKIPKDVLALMDGRKQAMLLEHEPNSECEADLQRIGG